MKKIFGIVFLFMIIFSANTQWVQIPNGIGPNSFIGGLASIGNNILLQHGILLSYRALFTFQLTVEIAGLFSLL